MSSLKSVILVGKLLRVIIGHTYTPLLVVYLLYNNRVNATAKGSDSEEKELR